MGSFSKSDRAGINYIDETITLSTLASKDVISVSTNIDGSREQGFRALRGDLFITLKGSTPEEGPILVGLSTGLTAAEIEEALESDPQDSQDHDAVAKSMRPVWPLATFFEIATSHVQATQSPIVWKPRWSFVEGQGLEAWAYNLGTGALTTGATVSVFGKIFGVWLND